MDDSLDGHYAPVCCRMGCQCAMPDQPYDFIRLCIRGHGLIFQQSIGSVFTGYGSCGALDFTSPLTESDVISGNAPIESEALVRVYPNPLKDYLFIEAVDFRSGEIRVYSLLGSLVYAGDLNHNRQNNLDLSSLTNGVYLVKVIIDETKCTTYTIIKS